MKKAKINIENVIAYIQGKIRYEIYYSPYFFWLMRTHIREQIDWRISIMDKECYQKGSCKLCGCETTALQMANKACDKPCYPEMLNKKHWGFFKLYNWWICKKDIFWKFKEDVG